MVIKTPDKKQAGTTICSFAYELDKAGIRQSVTNKDGKYERFGYDPSHQLKSDTKWSAKVPGTRDYQYLYDYDPNGNRLLMFADGVETAYVYGDNSELTDAGGSAWTYDHFGNAITMGNTNVSYDFQGHALTMSEISKGTDTHEYDGDGRRMRSKINGASNWTHFVHDELSESILVEYQAAPNPRQRLFTTYGVGLISSSITGASPTKRWFHFDGLGSTAALTDANENITDTYEFSAFGVQESSTGSSVNPFRYVGQWGYYDDVARGSQFGLLLLGVRYYSRDVGRFLTWDRLPFLNLYLYAYASPTMEIDPTGLIPPIHGRYCGPQSGQGVGRPVDDLDQCCCQHDRCWEIHRCTASNQFFYRDCALCSSILCDCLKAIKCKTARCKTLKAIFMAYACTVTPGLQLTNKFWRPGCHGNRFYFKCDAKGRVIG
jgi:RHS repeat-associated protein